MEGLVYFITTTLAVEGGENRFVAKIGFTRKCPYDRLNSLQTGCPSELELHGYLPGNRVLEGQMHKRFAYARIRGEWFDLHDDDLYYTYLSACDWAGNFEREVA